MFVCNAIRSDSKKELVTRSPAPSKLQRCPGLGGGSTKDSSKQRVKASTAGIPNGDLRSPPNQMHEDVTETELGVAYTENKSQPHGSHHSLV